MSEDHSTEQMRPFVPVTQAFDTPTQAQNVDTALSQEKMDSSSDVLAPECLPCIDTPPQKKEKPDVSPENLPMVEKVPPESVAGDGMLPGFDVAEDAGDNTLTEVASDADLPPEVEPRNNPVFIDTTPIPDEKEKSMPEKSVAKAPLVFTEESPVPTRNGAPVPDYRERLRQATNNVRRKSFRPMSMNEINSNDTVGMIMVKARKASGYSLDDVKLLTRIAENYIVDIENDNVKKIPAVYCSAYILALCNAYRLDAQVIDFITDLNHKIQSQQEQLPVEIMQEINRNVRINEEEERRLNHIFTGILIAVGVLLILGLWAVVVMILKHNAAVEQQKNSAPVEQVVQKKTDPFEGVSGASSSTLNFDESKLKNLIPHPAFEFHTLEMSDTPAVNRSDNGK